MEKRKISMGFLNTSKFESELMCNDKASSTYLLEKERFTKDLLQFHTQRGSPLNRIPRLNGKPLDLYALYLSVTRNGGWERVTNEEKWFEVLSSLDLNKSCGNADFALRQIYIKYLHYYEKVHYFGQEVDIREDQNESEEASRKKTANHIGGVVFSYNHQQHNISDSTRELLGVARDSNLLFNANYASLEKSLASGLPNEVDFAINICLLLSNDSKHVLKGPKSIKVVELLLSHVGIFKQGPSSYSWDFENDTNLNFEEFWFETVKNKEVLQLVRPENSLSDKVDLDSQAASNEVDIFSHCRQRLGVKDKEGQRVTQVAHIVRNFLVDEENVEALASSTVLFRFLMLCTHNNFGCIRQLGLDALSYLSSKILLDPVDSRSTRIVLRLISRCVHSVDKFEIVRGCDLISQLSQSNEDDLCVELDESLYSILVRMLTLHDLQLLLASLEALYQLSENGHVPCNAIVSVHKSIDTLLDLLTIDAQKQLLTSDLLGYGEQPEPILSPPVTYSSIPPFILTGNVQPITCAQPNIPITVPVNNIPFNSNVNIPIIISTNAAPQVVLPVVNVVTNGVALPSLSSNSIGNAREEPPEPVPPQISAMIANFNENENTAFNWLTSQYEFVLGSEVSLSKMEMFRKYISECSIHGLQKVVSPTSFENCIKAAFPHSKIVSKDNSTDVSFCGVVKKSSLPPKQGASQSFPAIEQVLNQRSLSAPSDEKLLEGLDKDLVSVAADVGIEIVSDLPPKPPSGDVQNAVDSNHALPETTFSQANLSHAQNSSNQLPATVSIPVGVSSQQLLHQQLAFQKIMPSFQQQPVASLPAGFAQSLSIANQGTGQSTQVQQSMSKQISLNANIINSVLAQQSRLHPPASNSAGLTALQAQLLKQVIESQRLAPNPVSEQKSGLSPSSPPPGDLKKRKMVTQSSPLVRPTKKRKGETTETSVKYYCEWSGCEGLVFETFASIYQHIVKQHFEDHNAGGTMVCMWSGCDGMPRQKWSFMAHILERHLNENILRLWSLKHIEPSTNIPPHPPSTMYPPNAALQAIRRFSARPPFPEFIDIKEETTSKHVHLTAALILRNLARYSAQARSLIKKHESRVAFIAFSDTESSCALSSCLYELHHFKN